MTEQTSGQARVLVADDEAVIRHFYIKALQPPEKTQRQTELHALEKELFSDSNAASPPVNAHRHDFDLTLCTSSTEAVDCVIQSVEIQKPFSVVFLDIRMPPGPDGVWAAEQIRKLDRDVEIVMATAFSDIHPGKIAERVPPVHKLNYLQKPFHIIEISHLATTLSAKWKMEKELRSIQAQLETHIIRQKNELAEAYETLEKMQKLDALGMVAGGIAHDFNNILSCIIGHVELGFIDTTQGDPVHKRMESIRHACFRARDLVNRILVFSKQQEPVYSSVKLQHVLDEVLKLIQGSIPANVKVETDIDPEAGPVVADPTQMHQVVMNLCTNAFHAMGNQKGVLSVTLSKHDPVEGMENGPLLKLSISDTGCGMDPATTDKIFDPYFTTKEKDEGTGLGLSVTHGIIKKLGGIIHVTSTPGKGTCFDIFLKTKS